MQVGWTRTHTIPFIGHIHGDNEAWRGGGLWPQNRTHPYSIDVYSSKEWALVQDTSPRPLLLRACAVDIWGSNTIEIVVLAKQMQGSQVYLVGSGQDFGRSPLTRTPERMPT